MIIATCTAYMRFVHDPQRRTVTPPSPQDAQK